MTTEYQERLDRAAAFPRLNDFYIPAVAKYVADMVENLGAMVGDRVSDSVFLELIEGIEDYDKDYGTIVLENADHVTRSWPLTTAVEAASAYAHFGVVHNAWRNEFYHAKPWLVRQLDLIEKVVASNPGFLFALPDLLKLARDRLLLDEGRDIPPDSLARLAGVSVGAMRNLLSGKTKKYEPVNGCFSAADACSYLDERCSDFLPTIWPTNTDPSTASSSSDASIELDPIFVPVSADGSVFHPGLKRSGKFTVGAKGEETKIESFEEALSALQMAPTPNWRRPNENGHWGNVVGVRWERKTMSELETLMKSGVIRHPVFPEYWSKSASGGKKMIPLLGAPKPPKPPTDRKKRTQLLDIPSD